MIDGWGSLSEKGADSTTPEQDGRNGALAIETTTDKNNRKFAEIPGYEEIRRQIIDSNVSHSEETDGWSAAVLPESKTQGWVDPFEQTPGGRRESLAKRIVGGLKGLGEKLSNHGGVAKRKIGEVFNKAAETGNSLKETIGQAAQSAKERRAERRQQRKEARENRKNELATKRQERQERAQKRKEAAGERREAARNDRNAEVKDLRKRAGLREEIVAVEGKQRGADTEIAETKAEIEAMSSGELASAFERLTAAREAYESSRHPVGSLENKQLALAEGIAESAWRVASGQVEMLKLSLQELEMKRQSLESQRQEALDRIREINEQRGERITAAKERKAARRAARQEKWAGVKEVIGDGFQSAGERVSATAERIGEMRTTVAQRLRDIGSYLSRPVALMGRKTKETLTVMGEFSRRVGRAAVAGHVAFTQEMQNSNSNVGDRV
ncbi:MAG: hypothetical protein ACFNZR_03905 [Candidatus Nanosynbacter sp.]